MTYQHDPLRPAMTDITGLEHFADTSPAEIEGEASPNHGAAVVYLRVSTERQMHTAADIDADGNSIATQREATSAKARALKTSVAAEFVEPGNSAQTIAKRPVFRQLLKYVADHPEIRYVVIYMRSRVFRNYTDAAITKRALLERDVRLISAKEEFGDGYMADAMEAITDIMNEVQVRQSGEDIKVKMRHKAEAGGTLGLAKIGYLNVRKDFDGRLVNTIEVDQLRAPLVRKAFEQYATGDYSMIALGASIAEQGLTTRKTAKRSSQPLSQSQLAQMLRDPYYTGVVKYKGRLYPGRHEPLISKELFLKVQDVLALRSRRGQRDRVHAHYLRGLLYCQQCHVAGVESRMIYFEVKGNGGTYEYFVCRRRQESLCEMAFLPVWEVENAVENEFAAHTLDKAFTADLRTEVAIALEDTQAAERELRSNLTKQLHRLGVKEENLLDLASDGQLATAKLKERLMAVTLERQAIEERLAATNGQLAEGAKMLLTYLEMLEHADQLYAQSSDSIRRQLLDAFFKPMYLSGDDTIHARGSSRPAVRELEAAADAHREIRANKSRSPNPSAGTPAVSTSVGSLADFFRSFGLSKTTLVGLTGFEPATP